MSTEPPVKYVLEADATMVARAFGSVDAAIAKNILSQEKFDKLVDQSTKRHVDVINKRMIDSLVKQRMGIDQNAKSANSLRGKLDELAAATEKQALATRNIATGMQRIAPAFAAFGNQIRVLSPDVAQYSGALGRVGGAMGGIIHVLGGGAGLLAGGMIGLLGLAATAMDDARVKSEALAKAERDRAKAHMEASNALVASNKALFNVVRTPENIQKDLDETNRRLAQTDSQRTAVVGGIQLDLRGSADQKGTAIGAGRSVAGSAGMSTAAMNEIAALQSKKAALTGELEAAKKAAEDERKRKAAEAAAGRKAQDARDKPFETMRSRIDTALEKSKRRDLELSGFQAQLNAGPDPETVAMREREAAEIAALDRKKEALALYLEEEKATWGESTENWKAEDEKRAGIEQKVAARWDDMRSAGAQAFTTVATVGLDALHKLSKGYKMSAKEFLGAIGDGIWASGVQHFLMGVANTFIPGMQASAAGLMAVGGVEMATGLAFGAATRGAGSSAGAGGGGGRESATPISSDDTGRRNQNRTVHVQENHFHSVVPYTDDQAESIANTMGQGVRSGRVQPNWATGGRR